MSLQLDLGSTPEGITVRTGFPETAIDFYVPGTSIEFSITLRTILDLAKRHLVSENCAEIIRVMTAFLSRDDFHAVIIYALTNADLYQDDPRPAFVTDVIKFERDYKDDPRQEVVRMIRAMQEKAGWNGGGKRLGAM